METLHDDHHLHHKESLDQSFSPPVVVVMVPFLLQSHLNQLFIFSQVISSYNIPVHYITSSVHIKQVKSRSSSTHSSSKIQFHEFNLPSLVSPPPTKNVKTMFPEHLVPCFEASAQLREPIFSLVRSLSSLAKRVVIVHDGLMAYSVQDSTSLPNTETYSFQCCSAFASLMSAEFIGLKSVPIGDQMLQVGEIPSYDLPPGLVDLISFDALGMTSQSGELYNSCRSMEGLYLDLLAERGDMVWSKKIWAVGPLLDEEVSMKKKDDDKCLEWLDKQEPNSGVYVSFGTTVSLSDEQINELAVGLEESGTKFMWVLRDADKVNVFDSKDDDEDVRKPKLPQGFEERMKGTGMVVRDWAPQLDILRHASTGSFMSHCGWNSCMESICFGVPIIAWPMHTDQPLNAMLIAQVLKVGLAVMDLKKPDELVSCSMISQVVKKMMRSDEGSEIRKRTEEMGQVLRLASAEGRVTRLEWDSFIHYITR